MSETFLSALTAAGGNSRAARSLRARLQWRDRYGRWIEMGRGVKFKVRGADGAPRSVIGSFVGAVDSDTGQVYVKDDPSGLPDGFYEVSSRNAQEFVANLSEQQLADRNITLGQHKDGTPVGERAAEDIPDITEMVAKPAPLGWKAIPGSFNGKKVIETEDGDFRIHYGGKTDSVLLEDHRAAPGEAVPQRSVAEAFKKVTDVDMKREEDGDEAYKGLGSSEEIKAKVEGMTRDDKIDQIKFAEGQVANDRVSPDQKQRAFGTIRQLKKELEDAGEPYDPEGSDSDEAFKARRAAPEPVSTGPQKPTVSAHDIDTSTFDVSPEGFLVPTGKSTNDISPEGLASFMTAEKESLSKGGARLVVDTDAGTAEIHNSADTIDNAKAQAGGLGTDRVLDLAAGKEISVSEGTVDPNSPDVNPNLEGDTSPEAPNAEDRNTDAVEPQPAQPGPDAPASPEHNGEAERTAEPDAAPDAGGAGTGDPNKPAAPAADDDGAEGEPDRADSTESEPAAAPGSVEDLKNRRKKVQAALDNTGDPKDIIALNEQADELDTRIAAKTEAPDSPEVADEKFRNPKINRRVSKEEVDAYIQDAEDRGEEPPTRKEARERILSDRKLEAQTDYAGEQTDLNQAQYEEDERNGLINPDGSRKSADGERLAELETAIQDLSSRLEEQQEIQRAAEEELNKEALPADGEKVAELEQAFDDAQAEIDGLTKQLDDLQREFDQTQNADAIRKEGVDMAEADLEEGVGEVAPEEPSLAEKLDAAWAKTDPFPDDWPSKRERAALRILRDAEKKGDLEKGIARLSDEEKAALPDDIAEAVGIRTPEAASGVDWQAAVRENEGISITPDLQSEPTEGYMVARPGFNQEIPEADFFDPEKGPQLVKDWVAKNQEELDKPGAHIGIWWDKKNKEVVLDVSENILDPDEAFRLGTERNQQSIWDVVARDEISTGGTGDRQTTPEREPYQEPGDAAAAAAAREEIEKIDAAIEEELALAEQTADDPKEQAGHLSRVRTLERQRKIQENALNRALGNAPMDFNKDLDWNMRKPENRGELPEAPETPEPEADEPEAEDGPALALDRSIARKDPKDMSDEELQSEIDLATADSPASKRWWYQNGSRWQHLVAERLKRRIDNDPDYEGYVQGERPEEIFVDSFIIHPETGNIVKVTGIYPEVIDDEDGPFTRWSVDYESRNEEEERENDIGPIEFVNNKPQVDLVKGWDPNRPDPNAVAEDPSDPAPEAPRTPYEPSMGAATGDARRIFEGVDDPAEALEKLRNEDVYVLDFETTGLEMPSDSAGERTHNRPVQIAIIHMKNGEEVDRFTSYMNPEEPLGSWSRGLKQPDGSPVTDEFLADQPSIAEVMQQAKDFMGDNPIVLGQNVKFDTEILERESKANGIDIPIGGTLDSKELADILLPRKHPTKLDEKGEPANLGRRLTQIVDFLNEDGTEVKVGDAHEAAADSEMAYGAFEGMLKRADRDGQSVGNVLDDSKNESNWERYAQQYDRYIQDLYDYFDQIGVDGEDRIERIENAIGRMRPDAVAERQGVTRPRNSFDEVQERNAAELQELNERDISDKLDGIYEAYQKQLEVGEPDRANLDEYREGPAEIAADEYDQADLDIQSYAEEMLEILDEIDAFDIANPPQNRDEAEDRFHRAWVDSAFAEDMGDAVPKDLRDRLQRRADRLRADRDQFIREEEENELFFSALRKKLEGRESEITPEEQEIMDQVEEARQREAARPIEDRLAEAQAAYDKRDQDYQNLLVRGEYTNEELDNAETLRDWAKQDLDAVQEEADRLEADRAYDREMTGDYEDDQSDTDLGWTGPENDMSDQELADEKVRIDALVRENPDNIDYKLHQLNVEQEMNRRPSFRQPAGITDDGPSDRPDAYPEWDDLTPREQEQERELGEDSRYEEARTPVAPAAPATPTAPTAPAAPAVTNQTREGTKTYDDGSMSRPTATSNIRPGDVIIGPDGQRHTVTDVSDAPGGNNDTRVVTMDNGESFRREGSQRTERMVGPIGTIRGDLSRLSAERDDQIEAIDSIGPDASSESVLPQGNDPDNVSPGHENRINAVKAKMQGKDMSDEDRAELTDALDSDSLSDRQLETLSGLVDDLPNRANTTTALRPANEQPEANSTADQAVVQAERDDPDFVFDEDLTWQTIKDENPDHVEMSNGDLLLETVTKTTGKGSRMQSKKYDLMVRRTKKNRFVVYIRETLPDGTRRAKRIGNSEWHSYETLEKRFARGRGLLAGPRPSSFFSNNHETPTENLGTQSFPEDDFLGDIGNPDAPVPTIGDEKYDALLAVVADYIRNKRGNLEDIQAALQKIDPGATAISTVMQAVIGRAQDNYTPEGINPFQLYDGEMAEVGMYVDWTDWHEYKDWWLPNGQLNPARKPNKRYGQVTRGIIKGYVGANSDGKGHTYGDHVWVQFIDAKGRPVGNWVKRSAQNLRLMDESTEPGQPFFSKREEWRSSPEALARRFNVPGVKDEPVVTHERPSRDLPKSRTMKFTSRGSLQGYSNVAVPTSPQEIMSKMASKEIRPTMRKASEMSTGMMITRMDDKGDQWVDSVIRIDNIGDGQYRIHAARPDGKGNVAVDSFVVSGDAMLPAWTAPALPSPGDRKGDPSDHRRGESVKVNLNGTEVSGVVLSDLGDGTMLVAVPGNQVIDILESNIKTDRDAEVSKSDRDDLVDQLYRVELPKKVRELIERGILSPNLSRAQYETLMDALSGLPETITPVGVENLLDLMNASDGDRETVAKYFAEGTE